MPLEASTVRKAAELYRAAGSMDAAAESVGLTGGTFNRILIGGAVSRETENMFRQKMGMRLLPDIVSVEVPQGCDVKIVRPRPKRKRKKRYSVPADPYDAADYLSKRMTPEELAILGYKLTGVWPEGYST